MSKDALADSPTPQRLGVHLVDGGVTVGVWAAHATGVFLCLFDAKGKETRLALNGPTNGVWHALVPDIRAGQRYGFRASGPWNAKQGLRYNVNKLLLDPYGRGLEGELAKMIDTGASVPLMPRRFVGKRLRGRPMALPVGVEA